MATSIIANTFKQTNLWGGIIPMQIFGFYALYTIFCGSAPNWWWITTILGYVLFVMIGVSAGYHRMICHKSFTTSSLTRAVILFLGALAGQESPIFWATVHRGYHHKHADTDLDPHSPKHGFWHSYIFWMFRLDDNLSIRSTIDLFKDPVCAFIHRHYHKILWGIHIAVALINFDFWLYFMLFPSFIGLHSFALNTSANHLRWLGYRNYNIKDDSVNSPLLFCLIFGEAWHNNHHGDPRNANYGGKHWWELDPTWYIIKILKLI